MKTVCALLVFLSSLPLAAQCPFSVSETIFHVTACTPCNGGININPTSGTPPYTYSWAVIGATTSSVTGLCPGSYTVTITDAVNCTVTDTVEVFNLIMNISTSITSPIMCNGESNGQITASVTGSSPFTYSWSPAGGTDAVATGLGSGCYVVTVTDVNGCTKTATECIFQPPPLSLFANGNTAHCGMCDGDAGAIAGGGTSPYTYVWSNSVSGQTNTGLCGGNYTVTVTDNNGCTNSQVVTIGDAPGPVATPSVNTVASCAVCCDGVLDVNVTGGTAPYIYDWQPGGITTSTVTGICTGTYTVCVTDANGCTSCDTIFLPFTIGLQEEFLNPVSIYPNPVQDELYFELTGPIKSDDTFIITDPSGRVFQTGALRNSGENRIPLTELPSGFYFIKIVQDGKVMTAFFIAS